MKPKRLSRALAMLLVVVMTITQLPLGVFAFDLRQDSAEVRSGIFTADNGAEYAVLYNDYIAVYVSKTDGGFAVLPATEPFDGTKPLSHTAFRIDGDEYRFGGAYDGVTGEVSIAPSVNENDILEAHQQIGDFIVSQYFALTQDTAHENSHAVKVGYAAEYFGSGTGVIAARILLDTQFSPDESIPVLLRDGDDNAVLVETEVEVSPAPVSAAIDDQVIADEGFSDQPNKGFAVFEDKNWDAPSRVVFAGLYAAEGYDYTPDWETPLFDGGGADSALLLYWNENVVEQGNAARFGVNYGFYDLKQGKVKAQTAVTANSMVVPFADTSSDSASLKIYDLEYYAPQEWFSVHASVSLARVDDMYGYHLEGNVRASDTLTLWLSYKPGTPQLIRDMVKEYEVALRWEQQEENVAETIAVDEPITVSLAELFATREDEHDLLVEFRAKEVPPEGYALVRVLSTSSYYDTAAVTLTGTDGAVTQYETDFQSATYLVMKGTDLRLDAVMPSSQYYPWTKDTVPEDLYIDYGSTDYPILRISEDYSSPAKPITDTQGDEKGPFLYTYTFQVPDEVSNYELEMKIFYDENGTVAAKPYPINIKVFTTAFRDSQSFIHGQLMGSLTGANLSGGVYWSPSGGTITLDTDFLGNWKSEFTYDLNAYKAGTTTPVTGANYNNNKLTFDMPAEPVDIVLVETDTRRVFNKITGGGTATVTLNSSNGTADTPLPDDTVYVYVSNIETGYSLEAVTSSDVFLAELPGGGYSFTMPGDKDVTISVKLEEDQKIASEMYSVNVLPLAGEGMTRYDIAFWTDTAAGKRLPYQVDEAGRIGRIRAGTIVKYALYPTSWETNIGSTQDMQDWVADGLYIHGVGEAGKNLLTTPIKGPGYYPDNYGGMSANAASFTMPEKDVTFEITGYKATRNYNMRIEAYDQSGKRIELPSSVIRTDVQSSDTGSPNYTASGLTIPFKPNDVVSLELLRQFGDYTFDYYAPNLKPMYITAEQNGKPINVIPVDADDSNTVARYKLNQLFTGDAVVKIRYKLERRTLAITGFEHQEWTTYRPEEVRVYYGPGEAGLYERSLTLRPDRDGEFKTQIVLRWEKGFDNGINYTLPANGTGFTATLLREEAGRTVYDVTLTDNAEIAIVKGKIAPDLNFYRGVQPDSPNTKRFVSISVDARENLRDVLLTSGESDSTKTQITKVTLSSKLAEPGFPKTVTDTDTIMSAISYPSRSNFNHYIAPENIGKIARIDVRTLFGLAEDFSFGFGGTIANDYTLTIEWAHGVNRTEKNSASFTFTLDPKAFAPNDITFIALKQSEFIFIGSGTQVNPDVTIGDWVIVPGIDEQSVIKDCKQYGQKYPLVMLTCADGFSVSNGSYTAQGTIILNGHAYFKNMPYGGGAFTVIKDAAGIVVTSEDMSLGSKTIPVWLPIQVGSSGGAHVGSDTLKFTLLNGKTYSIPAEIPEYHKPNGMPAEEAKEEWLAEVEDLLEDTIVIKPENTGAELSLTIGDYEMKGLTAKIDDVYLLGHGFNIGGELSVQIPGTSNPVFRVAIVMMTSDNTAKLIPIDNIWAEGEGTVKLPDFIGGYGGQAYGVFNTYTQDFGFEGAVNFQIIELSGEFYMARSERLKMPVLDRFSVSITADAIAAGIGAPPAPAQIIELNGISMGVSNLADTVDYDPRRNTIPTVRVNIGASFRLVEVLSFEAEMWSEMFSAGIAVSGDIGIGPFALPILENLSFEMGVKDGPFEEYEDAGLIVKGKRSLLFFINAHCSVSLFGIVKGGGGFDINLQISPALWEKRGGFSSASELTKFLELKVTASGYLFASINVPLTNWTIADADVRVSIAFEPGVDIDYAPFGFRQFEFVATERFLGMKVSEDRFDLIRQYPGLKNWVLSEVNKLKDKVSKAKAAEASLSAMSAFMADPAASGIAPDESYRGEHKNLAFGAVAARSDDTRPPAASAGRMGIAPMSLTQDKKNITVQTDGTSYTHLITVPDDGADYVLQLEGMGSDVITAADINAFKPNGQALTIREITGTVSAAQAEFAYNAATIDGVLTLSLSDFRNVIENTDGKEVETGFTTLPGVWQVISQKPFISSLVRVNALPGVKSLDMTLSELAIEFENIPSGTDYYYDVTLERKASAEAAPDETFPLIIDAKVTNNPVTLDLAAVPYGDAADTYDVNELLSSGDWYARVTLKSGRNESYTLDGVNVPYLITEYVDDRLCGDAYTVTNSLLSGAVWTPNLTATPGGNESVDITWSAATPPADMVVAGYHIRLYDENGAIGSRTTGTDGAQSVELLEYNLYATDTTSYVYNLPGIPPGTYTVGVVPLYAERMPDGGVSPVTRQGNEERSASVKVVKAEPPTLSIRVENGSYDAKNGLIFAAENAVLIAEAGAADVSVSEYGGSPITFDTVHTLASYTGKTLVISAENNSKDRTTLLVTVYAVMDMPTLLLDNYDPTAGAYCFTAFMDTGKYTVTGQTEPGAMVGGAVADGNGRFELSGMLDAGVDTDIVTLSVSNEAGMVTMREVSIMRGTQKEPVPPVNPPYGGDSSGDSSAAVQNMPAGDGTVSVGYTKSGGTVTLNLSDSKISEIISKSQNNTAIFDLTKITGATDVALSKTALIKLADAGLDVEFRFPGGSVILDADAADSAAAQANGANISVSMEAISQSSLTEAQRAVVESGDLVFDISVFSGAQQIHNFDGTITVSVQYSGKIPVAVWYLNDAGELEEIDCVYDPTEKTVTFTVNHLSLYLIRADGTVSEAWTNPFEDVKDSDWFYEYVEYVFTNGLMTGTSLVPMLFSPNMTATRGMIVTVLYRYAGSPGVSGFTNPFSDVDKGKWYSDAVKWAAANGIVSGYGNGRFGPEDNITRQDLAVILNNFAKKNGWQLPIKRDYQSWSDEADIANYAKEAIEAFFKANVVNGRPGNLFDPKGEATRAELAAMLTRFLEAVK